jgi:3-oxoacyl-[acyl-carrier-protein] synthase-3
MINIKGYGLKKANHKVYNNDLEKIVDTSDEWIKERTGIESRYISEEENTSDLGYEAAKQAIEDANINKEDIDVIIVATMTPDYFTPSCASLIQAKLGITNVLAFDLNAACSGFLYAFQVACELVNHYKNILVIGSETVSKIIDWTNRDTCVLFGDGAGAVIINKGNRDVYHFSNSIGNNEDLVAKGLSLTHNLQNQIQESHYLSMNGKNVFKFAVSAMKEAIEEVLNKANLTIDDIDYIIPHQANYRIISYVSKKMNIDIHKFYINLYEYGNTSSASIPIALSEAKQKGYINDHSRIILVGFGSGLTYGATLIERGK